MSQVIDIPATPNELTVTLLDAERLRELTRSLGGLTSPHRSYARALAGELSRARLVAPPDVPPDVVTMRSRVRIRDVETGKRTTYTLVYPNESNGFSECLSVLAPLGTAILGARIGDVIRWRVPAGLRTVAIEKILYQPEAAGQYEL